MAQESSNTVSKTQAIAIFDIDGVLRDVSGSYRRAIADTVEHFTAGKYRPTQADIDRLKSEGLWNNDWQAAQELIYRYGESQDKTRSQININYDELVTFFQGQYLGGNGQKWTGYICDEPLLVNIDYFQQLSTANIAWGFFSGAPRSEANYLLTHRLGLNLPVLVAMADAPDKPDPTGLFAAVNQLQDKQGWDDSTPVFYVGDTVADMYVIEKARVLQPDRRWVAVGILPPHVQTDFDRRLAYTGVLQKAGANIVLGNVQEFNVMVMADFLG